MRKSFKHLIAAVVLLGSALVGVAVAEPAAGALPPYTCGTATGGSTAVHSHVTNVTVGRHLHFDRFVITVSTLRLPQYTITPKSSARFTLDPSGQQVQLLGSAGLKIVLHTATGRGTYLGPADFRTGFPQLREARLLGDFEGYVTWGLGLAHQSCKRVFKLTGPTRLVVDVPH